MLGHLLAQLVTDGNINVVRVLLQELVPHPPTSAAQHSVEAFMLKRLHQDVK